MTTNRTADMLLGAFVADAASLGLHWLYDPDRIAQIADCRGGRTAFTPIDAAHFDGEVGYFAHGAREDGMQTQYGEVLRLVLRSIIAEDGQFDAAAYADAFANHFGPGGSYGGYIDRPTRGALGNIAAAQSPSGIDDDQLPAVATLPAIIAAYRQSDALDAKRRAAMQITNVNDTAEACSAAFADLLSRVMAGDDLSDALASAAAGSGAAVRDALQSALSTAKADSTDFAGEVGRACHLPMAGPVIFHILQRCTGYRDAVESNIRAGGDSAGRAIVIGAVMGASRGIATENGIPLSWILKLQDAESLWQDCRALG